MYCATILTLSSVFGAIAWSALIVTAASGPPTHHFSRATLAMAGKKRRAEPEEEAFSEDDSELDEEEDGEGAPPDVVVEEDDDDELEAEMAALEAIQREKRGGAGGADKVRINNKPGLLASLEGTCGERFGGGSHHRVRDAENPAFRRERATRRDRLGALPRMRGAVGGAV